jgi:ATP-dependent DNA ligase
MSKRKDSAYCSGRSPDWLKVKPCVVAPAKLPPEILAKLHDGIVKGLNDPDVRG